MSAAVAVDRWRGADAWRALFRDRPIIPLIVLLGILILIIDIVDPGIVSPLAGRTSSFGRPCRWRSSPAARRSPCSPAASTCRSAPSRR